MQAKFRYVVLATVALMGSAAFTAANAAGSGSAGAAGAAAVNPSTGMANPTAAQPIPGQNTGATGLSSAPGSSSSTTTGMGSGPGSSTPNSSLYQGNTNQPGVPNTSTPGKIGTGASPSGLPGDDPNHPGFPGKVGQ